MFLLRKWWTHYHELPPPAAQPPAGELEIHQAPGFEVRGFCHGERRRKAREEIAVVLAFGLMP
jgi:hypothetical protein